jgi:hypothetical protein
MFSLLDEILKDLFVPQRIHGAPEALVLEAQELVGLNSSPSRRYSLVISRSRGQRRRWRARASEAPSGLLPGDCWRRAGPTSATVSNAGFVMNRSNKAVNYSFEVIT